MGKGDKRKRMIIEGAEIKQPLSKEKGDSAILSGRRGSTVSLLLIAATAILIYSNIFSSPFLFDDKPNIVDNYEIRSLSNFWPPSGMRYAGYLSFAINFYFGGLDVSGYHLVNIAIHIINGILVWWLVILTFETPGMKTGGISRLKGFIALTSALIFVAHPIQTQAVTYIVQRFASLATLFYLLSLVLFIKGRLSLMTQDSRLKTILYISASLFSAILAMKTKEISFTLPFIIVLYEVTFLNVHDNNDCHPPTMKTTPHPPPPPLRGEGGGGGEFSKRLLYLIPFLIPLVVIPLSMVGVNKPLGDIIGDIDEFAMMAKGISRGTYLLTQFRVIVTYIRLLFFPVGQNLDYDYPLSDSLFEPSVFFSFIFLLSIFCLAIYLYIRSRRGNNGYALLVSYGILWFFITLSVESSIIPIRDVMFEHRLYLPSVGAVIAFSAAIFYVLDHSRLKASPLTVTCILLLVTAMPLGIAAYNRNRVWRDEVTLWKDVVKKSPAKARGYITLGYAYYKQGKLNEAIEESRKALGLRPDLQKVHHNLGFAYYKKGLIKEAIEVYKNVIMLKPDSPEVHYHLGVIYYEQGRIKEAIEEHRNAIILKPDYPEAHYLLGGAYYKQGRIEEAIEEYKESLRLKPDFPEAYVSLGSAYYGQGRMDEAHEEYRKALDLKPDHPEAHYFIAAIYYRKGRMDDAIGEYRRALELKHDLPRMKELETVDSRQ